MDKYDKAIKYLTENPAYIQAAWNSPSSAPGGCLFEYAERSQNTLRVGCLTQIRRDSSYQAQTPALTDEIRADKRIPVLPEAITIDDLPVFAEWQRRLDRELS